MSEAAAASSAGTAPTSGGLVPPPSQAPADQGGNPSNHDDASKPLAQSQDDDPEYEFPGRGKKKRSEWLKELDRAKGLEKAAHERNRESAQIKKQAQQLWEALGSNAREVLRQRGVNEVQLAQQILAEQMEEATLSEEQKRARDIQRERDEYKRQLEEYNQQKELEARQAEEARHAAQYENEIVEAIKQTGLPIDPLTVIRIAELKRVYLAEGIELPALEAAQELKQRDLKAQRTFLRPDLSDEQLDEYVPAELQERIRQKFLKQVQPIQAAPQPKQVARQSKPVAPARHNPNGYIDYDEWAQFKKGAHR